MDGWTDGRMRGQKDSDGLGWARKEGRLGELGAPHAQPSNNQEEVDSKSSSSSSSSSQSVSQSSVVSRDGQTKWASQPAQPAGLEDVRIRRPTAVVVREEKTPKAPVVPAARSGAVAMVQRKRAGSGRREAVEGFLTALGCCMPSGGGLG